MAWRQTETRVVDQESVAVSLTHGEWVVIDVDDVERVVEHRWTCHMNAAGAKYAYRQTQYLRPAPGRRGVATVVQRPLSLHRYVLGLGVGGDRVVFRDGDGLNCRKRNLVQIMRRSRMVVP